MAQPIDADRDWPLPHPWQEYFSNSQQRPYYANPVTNERLWSRHEVRQRCEPSARSAAAAAAAAPHAPHAHSHPIPSAAVQPAEHRGRQGLGFAAGAAAAAGDATSMQQGAPHEHQPRHSYSSSASHPPHGSGASYHQAPPPYDSNARRYAPHGHDAGRHDRERYSDRGGGFTRPHQSSSFSSSSRNAHQGGRDSHGRDNHNQGHGNGGRSSGSGGSIVLMTDEEQRVFRQLQLRTGVAGIEKEVEFRRDLFPRAPPPPAELFASPAFADPELMTAKDELNAAKNALDAMDLQAWCVSVVLLRMRWKNHATFYAASDSVLSLCHWPSDVC
jgi:hypothetical protein